MNKKILSTLFILQNFDLSIYEHLRDFFHKKTNRRVLENDLIFLERTCNELRSLNDKDKLTCLLVFAFKTCVCDCDCNNLKTFSNLLYCVYSLIVNVEEYKDDLFEQFSSVPIEYLNYINQVIKNNDELKVQTKLQELLCSFFPIKSVFNLCEFNRMTDIVTDINVDCLFLSVIQHNEKLKQIVSNVLNNTIQVQPLYIGINRILKGNVEDYEINHLLL